MNEGSGVRRRARCLGMCAGGLLIMVVAAGGQGAGAQKPLVIRVDVDTSVVDVSVLDSRGQPVTGLTAGDFTIEDGDRTRPITTFQAVQLPGPLTAPTGWPRDVAPDVVRNDDVADPRTIVVVMDDAMLPAAEAGWADSARRIARRIVEQARPADVTAILSTRQTDAQDFTADRSRLVAFIDRFRPGMRGLEPLKSYTEALFYAAPLAVMRDTVNFLATLAERRKLMFYIGVGLPLDVETMARPLALSPGASEARKVQELQLKLHQSLLDLLKAAQAANVHIYAFDPSGVDGMERAARNAAGLAGDAYRTGPASQGFLRTLAENTGGRAVLATNAPEDGIDAVFDENQSYYLLGYSRDDAGSGRSNAALAVHVRRPGVVVRHRSHVKPAARAVQKNVTPLQKSLEAFLPDPTLPMQIWAAPYWNASRREAVVAVAVGLRPRAPASGVATEVTRVAIVALDARARRHGSHEVKADLAVRPTATGWIPYEILSELRLRPGSYRIRAAAENARLATTGSVFVDVDVPDFANERLTVSGLTLGSTPRWTALPSERLKPLVPVVPTTRRHFSTSDAIELFARVYQGGGGALAPVNLRATVVDDRDASVFDRASTLEAAGFKDSGADISIRFAGSTFRAGRYLLTVRATLGDRSVDRRLPFRID